MRMLTPYWTSRTFTSDLFDEMNKFFEDARFASPTDYDERTFAPACEIAESTDHYLMSLDLPGMKKEDIKIEMVENVLTISGERKRQTPTDPTHKIQRYEKSYGFFKRSFTLPTTLDSSKVEARYENGQLELYLPKIQAAKPRQIEIQSDKSGFFEKLLGSKNENNSEISVEKS